MKANTVIFLLSLFLVSCNSYGQKQPDAANKPGIAVIELFTSEGCSSCPAAERALAQAQGEYGKDVYLLEFHVDYWNNLGWKDVFSSGDYTQRQQQYVSRFRLGSAYTPQAVVNGTNELVGSDKAKLQTLINSSLTQKPEITIRLSAKAVGDRIVINYELSGKQEQMLNIALVQKEAETNVRRGENAGRKLKHMNIVRVYKTIEHPTHNDNVEMILPPGLYPKDCEIIAYTQQKDNWKITGAMEAPVN